MAGATTADLIGMVRRRQGLVSRRDVGGRHRFRCRCDVRFLRRDSWLLAFGPGAAESARLFGCYTRPGSRPLRASIATGSRTALLVVVTARRACIFLCSVIRVRPWRRVYCSTKSGSFACDRRVCTPNIVGNMCPYLPPRPMPHNSAAPVDRPGRDMASIFGAFGRMRCRHTQCVSLVRCNRCRCHPAAHRRVCGL